MRKTLARVTLAVASLLASYAVVEWFVFPRLLMHLSLPVYGVVGDVTLFLPQTSKQGLFPRDYVALQGDSYAVGLGDCLGGGSPATGDCPSLANLLHERSGRDVVSLAIPGAGSIDGLIADPAAQIAYGQALSRGRMQPPTTVLLLFYEGNDLDNNLNDLQHHYVERDYDRSRFHERAYFAEFVRREFIGRNPIHQAASELGFGDRLLFFQTLRRMGSAMISGESTFSTLNHGQSQETAKDRMSQRLPVDRHLVLTIGGEPHTVPYFLEHPSMFALPYEVETALRVFEQSLTLAMDSQPEANFGVLYLPSPLTSYDIASTSVSIEAFYSDDRSTIIDTASLGPRSDDIAKRIQEITLAAGAEFEDGRPAIRQASAREMLHGPNDWKHFNERGYQALAEPAFELLQRVEANNTPQH